MKKNCNTTSFSVTPTRPSKKNTAVGDEDFLQRTSKLKAKKKLDHPPTSGTTASFDSFDDNLFAAKIASLGVSLGTSETGLDSTVCLLKKIRN